MREQILETQNLKVSFETRNGRTNAVNDVSFSLKPGEILALVGESGSGKTVTGLSLMGLLPDTARVSGRIDIAGDDVTALSGEELRQRRGRVVSMVFQEPMTALDPVFTVGYQMIETIRAHEDVSRSDAIARCVRALEEVGIPEPRARLKAYPSEMSGGMQQRVMIAMSLLCSPRILIADEPTTALDVTIQAQVLDLLRRLVEERELAILLVTHDLGVVAETCDRVLTMYAGQIIEDASVDELLDRPLHPYSAGLTRALPGSVPVGSPLASIPGVVPTIGDDTTGCYFADRCEHAETRCREVTPELETVEVEGSVRRVRCHRWAELELQGVSVDD